MDYRLYFFTNFYISSIQKGIQAGHCAVELMNGQYRDHPVTRDWATNHKTFIVLNGGAQLELEHTYEVLSRNVASYPFALFKEDAGLNYALTCVGIIVPEHIYEFTSKNRGCSIIGYGKGAVVPESICQAHAPEIYEDELSVVDFRGRPIKPVVTLNKRDADGVQYQINVELNQEDLVVARELMGKGLAN